MNKQTIVEFTTIDDISLDEFRYFIESLDEEKKTWSLDMNIYDKNLCKGIDDIETWYNVHKRYKFGIY